MGSLVQKPVSRRAWIGFGVFLLVAAAGLYIVKWAPYYEKAFKAFAEHSIGPSIISGEAAQAPAPSWSTAWEYSLAYFEAIWKAMVLAILLGSLIQVAIPREWMMRWFGGTGFKSTALAGVCGIPSMMCTCCAAPVVEGMRKQQASLGAAAAYWMSNTALNPAVLVFMLFVLNWEFTLLRLVLGLILVFGVSHLLNRFTPDETVDMEKLARETGTGVREDAPFLIRWGKQMGRLLLGIVPAYIVAVLVLGAARAWLFPTLDPAWADSTIAILGLAIAGTIFVIPTAAEIPVVQTLMGAGLGAGPAAALMFTLPVISLPSALMVGREMPWKAVAFLAASVTILGVIGGLVASAAF